MITPLRMGVWQECESHKKYADAAVFRDKNARSAIIHNKNASATLYKVLVIIILNP